jgi:hypothetical protein
VCAWYGQCLAATHEWAAAAAAATAKAAKAAADGVKPMNAFCRTCWANSRYTWLYAVSISMQHAIKVHVIASACMPAHTAWCGIGEFANSGSPYDVEVTVQLKLHTI